MPKYGLKRLTQNQVISDIMRLLILHLRELDYSAVLFGELPGQQPTRGVLDYLYRQGYRPLI